MKSIKSYKKILGLIKPPWQKFYEKTVSIDKPKEDLELKKLWEKNYYKSYVRLPIKHLTRPKHNLDIDITEVLYKRKSEKRYSNKPLNIDDVSKLLYFSAGLHESAGELSRFYPSAGARYPLEVYVIALNISGLKQGIYHYYTKEHALEKLDNIITKEISEVFMFPWVMSAGAIIVCSTVFNRTMMKYGNRGYNYIFIEAGHLGQNISLISTALKLGSSPVGGFSEKKLNDLLDLDSEFESSIYCFSVGNPQHK